MKQWTHHAICNSWYQTLKSVWPLNSVCITLFVFSVFQAWYMSTRPTKPWHAAFKTEKTLHAAFFVYSFGHVSCICHAQLSGNAVGDFLRFTWNCKHTSSFTYFHGVYWEEKKDWDTMLGSSRWRDLMTELWVTGEAVAVNAMHSCQPLR